MSLTQHIIRLLVSASTVLLEYLQDEKRLLILIGGIRFRTSPSWHGCPEAFKLEFVCQQSLAQTLEAIFDLVFVSLLELMAHRGPLSAQTLHMREQCYVLFDRPFILRNLRVEEVAPAGPYLLGQSVVMRRRELEDFV